MEKQTKNLIIFLAATFLWTWAFYAPIAIGHHNAAEMPYLILLIFGGMGPSVVGVSMILLSRDKAQHRDYFQRCFSLKRIRPLWWAVILLTFPVITALSIALNMSFSRDLPGLDLLRALVANPAALPLVIFIRFMSGPWSEEFGWRGYALDRLIARLGMLRGTLALGFLWAAWHIPLYFMGGTWHGEMGFSLAGFWSFIVYTLGLSLIMTCVFLNTNRSILSAMLVHFTSNFTAQLTAPVADNVEIVKALVMLAAGAAFFFYAVHPRLSTKTTLAEGPVARPAR